MSHTMALASLASLSIALLSVSAAGETARPSAAAFFVATDGDDRWSGTLPEPDEGRTDGPFATIERARDAIREMKSAGTLDRDLTVMIRGGTHYMRPVLLEPQDSGTPEHPIRYVAYPGETPVLSAGRPIRHWERAEGSLWRAHIRRVADGRWYFRRLRVGDEMAIRARYPNFDPEHPYTGGWLFAAESAERLGRFGASVASIHTPGDWIEWQLEAPADGYYQVWLYYGAQNEPWGRTDMAGRTVLQVDGGERILLQNLPDTGGWGTFRWSRCATIPLTAGAHTIRWTNAEGGGINFDAFAICTDANWVPEGTELSEPAPGEHLIVVQAEAYSAAEGKEMTTDYVSSPTQFNFREGDLRPWPRSPEAEIHIFPAWGWVSSIVQVDRIDHETRMVYLRGGNAQQEVRPGNRYYVDNVREELDAPGEWYLDRAAGELIYWPTDPAFPEVEVIAPVHDRIFELRGDMNADAFVTDLQFRGLTFKDTAYSPEIASVYQPEDAAIWLSAARGCLIEGNTFEHIGGYAVRLDSRSSDSQILGNTIAYTGQGGVILSGATATQAHDNLITGNHIHHCGQVYKHVAGVYVTTGSGNRIAHNLIHDVPRYGISIKSFGGEAYSHDNVVEYNEIRRTNLETNDTGAIETLGRDGEDSGNVIQYNLIVDSVGLKTTPQGEILCPHYTWGVYLDDHSSGTLVRGNIIVRNVLGGVMVHGGENNVIENNIMVEGRDSQLYYANIGTRMVNNTFVRNIVYYTAPDAALIRIGGWTDEVVAESDYNIFFHAGGPLVVGLPEVAPGESFDKWRELGFDTRSAIADPLFVDPSSDDYSLRPESPAFALGFEPIDVSKIGLRGYRPSE